MYYKIIIIMNYIQICYLLYTYAGMEDSEEKPQLTFKLRKPQTKIGMYVVKT